MTTFLVVGDNRRTLNVLSDNSIDAVITDPPYGLAKEPDMTEVLTHWLAGDDYTATGGGFMGKSWDSFVPGPATWREVFRVLKPGGHVVMFSGTRTWDIATLALRLAGFEIRDGLMWMYGSGFPKSMDVSKAIDKAGERLERGQADLARHIRECREAAGVSRSDLASWFPYVEVSKNWERTDTGGRVPSESDYQVLMERAGCSESWLGFVRSEDRRRVVGDSTDRRGDGTIIGLAHSGSLTEASTPEAEQWSGWGTALKPAWEPIVLARKPIVGTVAANVLAHGTGALNIDASRIGYQSGDDMASATPQGKVTAKVGALAGGTENDRERTEFDRPELKGRFPANVLLSHTGDCIETVVVDSVSVEAEVWECVDDCPVRLLDAQTGTLTSGKAPDGFRGVTTERNAINRMPENQINVAYGDSGGASRFFYSSKVAKKERNAGMPEGTKNDHPTVKPVSLMEYLMRLVTPPGGTVLDPFVGSGSTGIAAHKLGHPFVGLDKDGHSVAIARHRIEHFGAEVEVLGRAELNASEVEAEVETGDVAT